MSFNRLARIDVLRKLLLALARWRVSEKLPTIVPHIRLGEAVLDIGAGNCVLFESLTKNGFRVTPLDIDNMSFLPEIRPTLYDGRTIPFSDDCFDAAMLITVLHHTADPKHLLSEACRVAKRVIVVEEIYSGARQKYLTYLVDSVFNLEFFGQPRTNMTDQGWRRVFSELGLVARSADYRTSLAVLTRVTYVLDRKGSGA